MRKLEKENVSEIKKRGERENKGRERSGRGQKVYLSVNRERESEEKKKRGYI